LEATRLLMALADLEEAAWEELRAASRT
jgi:hypothetical protein